MEKEDDLVAKLLGMGFSEAQSRRAVTVTGSLSLEAAAGWIIDDGAEDDLSAPEREVGGRHVDAVRPSSDSFVFVNDDLKMVLLVRKDLEMSPGKIAAQCSHATLGAYRDAAESLVIQWQAAGEAIIVLGVSGEAEMWEHEHKAAGLGICTHIVRDAGRTEVMPSTVTVAAIGPAPVSKIDLVTGKLSLL